MSALKIPVKRASQAYDEGKKARELNNPKIPPHNNTPRGFCLKHWWLAGWNDADIELTKPYGLE